MNTAFLLMAQYEGRAIIPVDVVSKDYFNLTTAKFLAKTTSGEIELAVVRMEAARPCERRTLPKAITSPAGFFFFGTCFG